MTIIVEDGSIVAGANSYVTVADLISHATARGITLGLNAPAIEALLIKAMDYFESFDGRFKGDRTERDQPLSWPRKGAVVEGWEWGETEIPRQVLNAQLALCLEIFAGDDPANPPAAELPVVRERVEGAVEVEYVNPGRVSKVTKTRPSDTHIRLLLKHSGLFAVRA